MQKTLLPLFFSLGIHLLQAQNTQLPLPSPSLSVQGDTITYSISSPGNKLELDPQGFPGQIGNMLAENIHFHFTRLSDGKDIRLKSGGVVFTVQDPDIMEWRTTDSSDELQMNLNVSFWRDGALSYKVKIKALQDLELKELTMHIPLRPDSNFTWKKDSTHANRTDVAIGTPNIVLHYSLHGMEWKNEGKGGITVGIKGRSLLANNYSGMRSMKKGETLHYDFDLYLSVGNIKK